MNIKQLYSTLLCLSLVGMGFAQAVSEQEAATVAQRFLESQGKTFVGSAKTISGEEGDLLYFFNAENGFVVVSGDKSAQPVLSFSDQQIYNDKDVVPPFEMWINHYANQIEQIKKQHIVQPQFVSQWEDLLSGTRGFRTGDEGEPLLHSKWDQGEYYNYYCPRDNAGQNGRTVTGCVATAMGQLLYYFRFPEHGTGSYSYTDEHYGVQSADYENATYNYNAMCDVPTAINPEISKLIYHCGVGVDMHYGPNGSGMTNHSAARVLRTFFKLSPETEYLFRDSTDLNWDSVIVSHLSRNIPMYYAGWSVPDIDGHGFICDGYKTVDSAYYFHFNFGWSGYMDNYYYTNSLVVGGSNFNLAQELIINGYPDTTQYTYPTPQPLTGSLLLTADAGTFTDGSQMWETCASGMDFSWYIHPESQNLTSISLTMDYNIAEGDTLFISTGDDMTGPTAYTADTGTLNMTLSSPSISIRLVTGDSSESMGFRAQYTANRTELCSGTQVFTAAAGTITDGSNDSPYNNLTTCKFRIMLNSSFSAVAFHINNLDLEEGHDFLHFYNNSISEANHLLSLTGHLTDSNFVLDTRRLMLVLESDETGTDTGFDMDYTGTNTGIHSHTAAINLYPNPAYDHLTLACDETVRMVTIRDVEGRIVYEGSFGEEQVIVPVNSLRAGLYTITIQTENVTTTRKFVKL